MIKSDNEKVKEFEADELNSLKKQIKNFPAKEIIDAIRTVNKSKFPKEEIIELIKRVKGTSWRRGTLH